MKMIGSKHNSNLTQLRMQLKIKDGIEQAIDDKILPQIKYSISIRKSDYDVNYSRIVNIIIYRIPQEMALYKPGTKVYTQEIESVIETFKRILNEFNYIDDEYSHFVSYIFFRSEHPVAERIIKKRKNPKSQIEESEELLEHIMTSYTLLEEDKLKYKEYLEKYKL